MLKRKRGAAAIALTVLLAATALAGCGGNDKGNQAAATSGGAGSGSSTEAVSSSGDGQKPGLKYLKSYEKIDYNKDPVADFIAKTTGYSVKYDMLPQENPGDKLNLIMASGSDYDLVDVSQQDFFRYAQNGALQDLTSLIDQYGPNIKSAIKPESLAGATVDGKIYGIPTQNVSYIRDGLLIRTDWLKAVGMEMPKTIDEFTAVLKAFKEKDPGGNGKTNIPFTMASDSGIVDNLAGAFGMPVNSSGQWSDVDGKLVNAAMNPSLKPYATYLRSLYEQGLLDPEFATNKSETAGEKFTSGRAGVILLRWSSIPSFDTALLKNVPDATYDFIPPMTGPDGKKGFVEVGGYNKYTVVPETSKHPEDAIKMANALLDPETFKDLYIGEEGVTYKVDGDKYLPIAPAFFDQRGYSNAFVIGVDEDHFVDYWQARLHKTEVMYDKYASLNSAADADKVMDPLAFAPYLPKLAEKNNQLNGIVNDSLIKLIVDGVTDANIAGLQNSWKAAGGDEVAQEINDWYTNKK